MTVPDQKAHRNAVPSLARAAVPARSLLTTDRTRSTRRVWAAWGAVRLIGLMVLTGRLLYPAVDADVFYYGSWARRLYAGRLPWRDFHVEYPPGVLPLMALPGNAFRYELEFIVLALCADAAVLALLARTSPGHAGSWLWVGLPIALGPIIWVRLDVFVALALVGMLTCLRQERWRAAGACLAAATLLKLWPIALLPVLWWVILRRGRLLTAVWAVGCSLAPALIVVGYGGARGLAWMVSYQGGRGVEAETIWAVPSLLAHQLGRPLGFGFGHGSTELPVTGLSGLALSAALPLALAVASWFVWQHRARLTVPAATLLAVALVLASSKVLSPQYDVWAIAIAACTIDAVAAAPGTRVRLVAASVALAFTTQLVFPFGFADVARGTGTGAALATLHAAAVLVWVAQALHFVAASSYSNSPLVEPYRRT